MLMKSSLSSILNHLHSPRQLLHWWTQHPLPSIYQEFLKMGKRWSVSLCQSMTLIFKATRTQIVVTIWSQKVTMFSSQKSNTSRTTTSEVKAIWLTEVSSKGPTSTKTIKCFPRKVVSLTGSNPWILRSRPTKTTAASTWCSAPPLICPLSTTKMIYKYWEWILCQSIRMFQPGSNIITKTISLDWKSFSNLALHPGQTLTA